MVETPVDGKPVSRLGIKFSVKECARKLGRICSFFPCVLLSGVLFAAGNVAAEGRVILTVIGSVNGQIGDEMAVRAEGLERRLHRITMCSSHESCAWAEYMPERGVIDVSKNESIRGSYTGLDPAGLFWSSASMRSVSDEVRKELGAVNSWDEISYAAFIEAGDGVLDRYIVSPDELVGVARINEGKYEGGSASIYFPIHPGSYDVVVVFDGQPPTRDNSLFLWLSLKGYIVVYADYWNLSKGVGDTCLSGVPIEEYYFILRGLKDFLSSKDVAEMGYRMRGDRFHLVGGSRGVEAVRWMANLAPEYVASITMISGSAYGMPACREGESPWVFKSIALPSVPVELDAYYESVAFSRLIGGNQADEVKRYMEGIPEISKYWIPESCDLPSMFIYGENDALIDAGMLPGIYLKRCGGAGDVRVLELNSGHQLMITPWERVACEGGQEESNNCKADIDASRKAISMFMDFIESRSVDGIDASKKRLGECRRSYEDLMKGIRECVAE